MAKLFTPNRKVLVLMADYGNDPTEVSIPVSVFKESGLTVHFATENGVSPRCDKKMIEGITGMLLGANAKAKKAYKDVISAQDSSEGSIAYPYSWNSQSFSMDDYDLVFLPGGHDKGVRQLIDSDIVHQHLARYFPRTSRNGDKGKDSKVVAAICHGVQVLGFTPDPSSPTPSFPLTDQNNIQQPSFKSIIHACTTTALPGFMESAIYRITRLFLGDYYKTYGNCTPNVEDYVKAGLDDPSQFQAGPSLWSGKSGTPFVVVDKNFRYLSGRYPPDAELLAMKAVEMLKEGN